MNIKRGKILLKLHNCFFCHNNKNLDLNYHYPKIIGQHFDYLIWSIKQYQWIKNIFFFRKNFLMTSQVQNISLIDILDLVFFINNYYI